MAGRMDVLKLTFRDFIGFLFLRYWFFWYNKAMRSDEGGILRVVLPESMESVEDSTRQAEIIEEAILEIFNSNPQKKYKTIVDLSQLGNNKVYTSSKHRKVWARLASNEHLEKCAVIGSNTILKVVVNFIVRLSGRGDDIKWFYDEEKVLKWLKKD